MDIAVENFEKSVKKILQKWAKEIEKTLKDIESLQTEILELERKDELSSAEQERLKRCTAAREKLQKKVEATQMELRLELGILKPPPEPKKSDLKQLEAKIKATLEKIEKGLPLTDYLRLLPDIEFDWKKLAFKKLGVKLTWEF
jgi:predicted  nucleic acid-binding Zn-ribbon protein